MLDRDLLDRVDRVAPAPFAGKALRHISPGRDPLATTGARIHGGRWNPAESFGALYLALDHGTLHAEFVRSAARQGLVPEAFLPRELHELRVHLTKVLDLRDAGAAETVGLGGGLLRGDDHRPCQAIGDAAHYLGLEGVIAPSAAGPGDVLAVFMDRLLPDSLVESLGYEVWAEMT